MYLFCTSLVLAYGRGIIAMVGDQKFFYFIFVFNLGVKGVQILFQFIEQYCSSFARCNPDFDMCQRIKNYNCLLVLRVPFTLQVLYLAEYFLYLLFTVLAFFVILHSDDLVSKDKTLCKVVIFHGLSFEFALYVLCKLLVEVFH